MGTAVELLLPTVSVKEINLDLVDRDPGQPREIFDEARLEKLRGSIKQRGLIQMSVVKPHPEIEGRYMIVAGERRIRALRALGYTRYPCVLREGDADTFELSLVENMHRVDLNPMEEAESMRKLREKKVTWKEISELTGRDEMTLRNKLKLLELPSEIQEMIRKERLPQGSALNLAQYRGKKREFIRLAQDLIAGRDPIELRIPSGGLSLHSKRIMEAKLPKDAHGLLRRVVEAGWKMRSLPLALQAFMELPSDVRVRAIGALTPAVQERLRETLVAVAKTSRRFLEVALEPSLRRRLNEVSAVTRGGSRDEDESDDHREEDHDRPAHPPRYEKKGDERRERHELQPPAPSPPRKADPLPARPAQMSPGPAPRVSPPEKLPAAHQSAFVSQRALEAMIRVNGGTLAVDLNQRNLQRSLADLGVDGKAQDVAVHALRAMQRCWRAPRVGPPEEVALVDFVLQVRLRSGDGTFLQFLADLKEEAVGSKDPVNLDLV